MKIWILFAITLFLLYTSDKNPFYCIAMWHYFSAILQILNTNRGVNDNEIWPHSASDVALLPLFWCKVALW